MLSRLLTRLRALLNLPTRVDAQFGRLRQELDERVRDVQRTLKSHDVRRTLKSHKEHAESVWEKQRAEHAELERELAATRKEVHDRLLQYHLQLGRLSRLLENGDRKDHADPIPLAVAVPHAQPATPAATAS